MEIAPPVARDPGASVAARLENAATALLAGAAAYVAVTSISLVVLAYAAVPFWDQWEHLPGSSHLASLFAQHSEHRIAFSRLVFTLDDRLFDGRNHLNLTVTMFIQLGHALLIALIAGAGSVTRVRAQHLFLALAVMLGGAQWSNFTWGFQHQFVAVFAFATLASYLVVFGAPGTRSLLGAELVAAVAAFTMANGVLVPVLVTACAALTRRPRREVALSALIAASLLMAYFHDYHRPAHHQDPVASLRSDPLALLEFFAAYVGSPVATIAGARKVLWCTLVGGVILAILAALAVVVVRRHARPRSPELVLVATAAFCAASAFGTASGRFAFGITQALESRYCTGALVLWASVLALSIRMARSLPARASATALTTLLVAVVAFGQRPARTMAIDHVFGRLNGHTALLADARDERALSYLFVQTDLVRSGAARMRRDHVSIFAEPWASWRGAPLIRAVDRVRTSGCTGTIELLEPADERGALRVTGWAYLTNEHDRPERIVFTNGHGTVVGYGFSGALRPDIVAAHHEVENGRVGFRGHIAADSVDGTLIAYALVNDEEVCRIIDTRDQRDHGTTSPM